MKSVLDVSTILTQATLSLVVAVVASLLTVWFALRRFYREKWWEAKLRAYTEVIVALHHIRRDVDLKLPAAYENRDTDTEQHKKLSSRHSKGMDDIAKFADISEFLFSTRSIDILRKLISTLSFDDYDGYVDYLEETQVAVDKCLAAIRASAKEDLRLPHQ